MILIRSIPVLLYVLTFVLLPHAHAAAHSHDCGADHGSDPGHSIQASCQLCELPVLKGQASCRTDACAESVSIFFTVLAAPCRKTCTHPPSLHQARAPPLMTA